MDVYEVEGHDTKSTRELGYFADEAETEDFAPFHYRTFRLLRLEIQVSGSFDLVFLGLDVESVEYPLEVHASWDAPGHELASQLWTTSTRTLQFAGSCL